MGEHVTGPGLDAAVERIKAMTAADETGIVAETVTDWGRFEGTLDVRMLDGGRVCELLADYAYFRPEGSRWLAEKGARVDGASIPKPLWSVIGGPFEGKYRDASVIHDVYCDSHERPWRETHRVFYEAMRCKGVGAARAKIMYYAVYRFGPRWPEPGTPTPEGVPLREAIGPIDADAPTLLVDAETIRADDPSLEAIEALADARRSPGESPTAA